MSDIDTMLSMAALAQALKVAKVSLRGAIEAAEYAAEDGYLIGDVADINDAVDEVIEDLVAAVAAADKLAQ